MWKGLTWARGAHLSALTLVLLSLLLVCVKVLLTDALTQQGWEDSGTNIPPAWQVSQQEGAVGQWKDNSHVFYPANAHIWWQTFVINKVSTGKNERDNYWTIYPCQLETFNTAKMTGNKLESKFKWGALHCTTKKYEIKYEMNRINFKHPLKWLFSALQVCVHVFSSRVLLHSDSDLSSSRNQNSAHLTVVSVSDVITDGT